MKKIKIFNDNYALGFGDLLNKLSFMFRKYQDDEVEFIIHDKQKVFNTFLLLKHFVFQEPINKKLLTMDPDFIRGKDQYKLINHEYWPARIRWENNTNGKTAMNFYTRLSPIFGNVNALDQEVGICKLFPYVSNIKRRYDTIELYGIDDLRGHTQIIRDKIKCLEENINILKNCSLFVCSEGGMAHLSRSMGVPTILFFERDKFNFYSYLKSIMNEDIQKLVHTKTEMFDAIDDFYKGRWGTQ